MTMKKSCPKCGGKIEVVDVPLGFGNSVAYLCENGHKVEGHERIYQTLNTWTHSPLRVVEGWNRWDDDLSAEYINPKTGKPINFPLIYKD